MMRRVAFSLFLFVAAAAAADPAPSDTSAINILVSGIRPSKGEKVDLAGMEVFQKAPGGYLIKMGRFFAASLGYTSNVIFLRSKQELADGERISGSAVYEGKTFSYESVTGAQKTVLELREVPR